DLERLVGRLCQKPAPRCGCRDCNSMAIADWLYWAVLGHMGAGIPSARHLVKNRSPGHVVSSDLWISRSLRGLLLAAEASATVSAFHYQPGSAGNGCVGRLTDLARVCITQDDYCDCGSAGLGRSGVTRGSRGRK